MPKGDVPGESTSATQPISHQAAQPRSPRSVPRRPDRLHPGVACGSCENRPRSTASVLCIRRRGKQDGRSARDPVLAVPAGGTNWPGAAYDPETHIVYAYAAETITPLGLSARRTRNSQIWTTFLDAQVWNSGLLREVPARVRARILRLLHVARCRPLQRPAYWDRHSM